MSVRIALLDTVALAVDLPLLGLSAGEVGSVVEVLGNGSAFEVEFVDLSGATYGLHTFQAKQLISLHTRGRSLRLGAGAA